MNNSKHSRGLTPPAGLTSPAAHWWVLIAIGAGTFMSALDGSVVNAVLPVISKSFNGSVASVEWVVTTYLLVLSALLLSFGRLGDIQGHKRIYMAGFAIFLAASMLCGLAPSMLWLVVFRAIQAFGAAMLSANSPAILTKSFPPEERGKALGLQATMTYLGLTVGPSLGGWLTQQFTWRAVFYINIPVGMLALLMSARFILADHPGKVTERFDYPGALAFMGGLVTLLLGLNQGHALGWTSWPILTLLILSVCLLASFVLIERKSPHPMLDLSLFSSRLFSASAASAVLNYICVYSILFLMPFYLLQGRGLNPAVAGLVLTAMPIVMAIVAPISGSLSDRVGTRMLTFAGMLSLAMGLYLLSMLGPQTSFTQVVLSAGIAGFGIGIFISPNSSALMGSAPRTRQGIASGILATSRNLGMVLGVGLSGAIFTSLLNQPTVSQANSLFMALHASFLAATMIALVGALIAAVRPSR